MKQMKHKMNAKELHIVSVIAKELKRLVPSMPMNLATRYAKQIYAAVELAQEDLI